MIPITESIIRLICPHPPKDVIKFIDPLNETCGLYEINTLQRQAMFMAQLAHESGAFYYTEELASGKAYEGRKDLGNTQKGDGVKFKGRGLIQITGRANYTALSKAFNEDFINDPELLESPEFAVKSAGWFWDTHHLNDLADRGQFTSITQRINGGQMGAVERHEFYNKAIQALAGKG